MAHRAEKKWKTPTGPSSAQSSRYRVVPNAQIRACSGMPHLADLSSGRPNNKEDIDLPCLRNSRNSLAHGQIINRFSRGPAPIAVSIAVVRTTSSKIVLSPGSLIKGRVLIRTTRARERSE
jgi:hypothetical protein